MVRSVGTAIFNIVVGLGLLVAGLSGEFNLIGTSSPTLLALVGGLIGALGIFQLSKTRRR
jgi:hypothetical protein